MQQNSNDELTRVSLVQRGVAAFRALRRAHWKATSEMLGRGRPGDSRTRAIVREAWREAQEAIEEYDGSGSFPEWVARRYQTSRGLKLDPGIVAGARLEPEADLVSELQRGGKAFNHLWTRLDAIVRDWLASTAHDLTSELPETIRQQARMKFGFFDPKKETLVNWVKECAQETLMLCRAQARDEKAFEWLVRKYSQPVRGYLRSRSARDDDVDDLLQQTWIAAWEKIHTYDPRDSIFYLWLRECIVRYILLRYHSSNPEIPVSQLMPEEPDLPRGEEEFERLAADEGRLGAAPPPRLDPQFFAVLLRTTFEKGGYPWQLIAFGFCKLLEWPPRQLVALGSGKSLTELTEELVNGYVAQFVHRPDSVSESFLPLRRQMSRTVGGEDGVLLAADPSRDRLKRILESRVGDTTLADYLSDSPEAMVSDWVYKVIQKVVRELRTGLSPETAEQVAAYAMAGGREKSSGRRV